MIRKKGVFLRSSAVLILAFFYSVAFVPAANFTSAANGITGADFLNLGVGARGVAMGGAFSAAVNDATAMYWNPAALTQTPENSATVMYAPYLADTAFDYGAYSHNMGRSGAFGVSAQYFSAGSITETQNYQSLGSFNPYDLAVSAGYAYALGSEFGTFHGFSIGASGEFIESQIISQAHAEAVNFGLLSPAYLDDRLKLAFTVSNLGTPMTFDQVSSPLPLAMRLGSSYRIARGLIADLDMGFPQGGNPYFDVGTEYEIWRDRQWDFLGRAGYSSYTLNSVDGFTGFSFGFGISREDLSFDYALVPYGGLGQAHRISLSFKWGGSPAGETFVNPPETSPTIKSSPHRNSVPNPNADQGGMIFVH